MGIFRLFNRESGRVVSAFALLVAMVLPAFTPAFASAAQVTERSIALSSSSKAATGVSYTVNFTAVAGAGAFVVDFCSDSPVIGQTCTAPGGFDATAAASTTTDFTDVTGSTSQFVVAGSISASEQVSVVVTGIENPAAAGPLYARIVTYDTKSNALTYESDDLHTGAVDEGGVAISITDTVAVSGSVLESMTFCAADAAITLNCGNASSNAPVLQLGETVGDIVALTPGSVSTGNIFTQISTNAVGGAVVNLKSGTVCGGLKRASAAGCDIVPALTGGITAGQAKFGVRTATASGTDGSATGTLAPVTGSGYNNTTYALNYLANNSSGVTSPFGDPFIDTAGAPANNQNMQLTFGASIANNTPAGRYATDLSMIATGRF